MRGYSYCGFNDGVDSDPSRSLKSYPVGLVNYSRSERASVGIGHKAFLFFRVNQWA